MATEKAQEMQQVDVPKKTKNAVKTTNRTNSTSVSEDELDFSEDNATPALKSLQALDLRVAQSSVKAAADVKPVTDSPSLSKKEICQLQEDYHNTRSELKSVYRENRDQSLQLRDLQKVNALSQEKNAHLREQVNQLRDTFRARGEKITKSEKSKYLEHIDMLDGHLTYLQHERQKREMHMEFLTEQTREANEGKSSTEAECRKLQRQVRDLSNNLTECKDDLLRLQPTSQVPDNEISDQYADLDQNVTGWVDDKTEDQEVLEDQFGKMKTTEDLPDLFQTHLTSDHLRMAKKYPQSQPAILRFLIHRNLSTFIFDDDIFLFGLDDRNVALLKGLEEGMKQLEPRRDAITLRRWRSETLQGLLKMENFVSEQDRQAKLISQTLQSALSCLISEKPHDEAGWEDLYAQVVRPAVRLATKLRLSMADYYLIPNIFTKASGRNPGAFIYEAKDSNMIDIVTHKVIRPDSMIKVAEGGRIGYEMLIITPALLRAQASGKGKFLICKPTILVRLDEPMGKRTRDIKALGAWTPSWFGADEAAA